MRIMAVVARLLSSVKQRNPPVPLIRNPLNDVVAPRNLNDTVGSNGGFFFAEMSPAAQSTRIDNVLNRCN